jgi:hypothetical protein
MTKLFKTGTVILLSGILLLSACGAEDANQPKPDSVIASVPTATPALTPTPTPIPAVLESDPDSIPEWVLNGDPDDEEEDESDDWVQDDGDAAEEEEEDQTDDTEYYEVGIVEDDENTDQGAEGNTAVALEIADVYSEPGGDPNTIIGTLDADERVTIQGNVDGWFVINYNGQRAYVDSELFG